LILLVSSFGLPGSFAGGAGSGADGATHTHWPGCVMEMGSSIKEVGMVVDVGRSNDQNLWITLGLVT